MLTQIIVAIAVMLLSAACASRDSTPPPTSAPPAPAQVSPVEAPPQAPAVPTDTSSPAANQVSISASLSSTVQGGRVWVMVYPLDNLPTEVVSTWNVGLTDGSQHSYVLGRLAEAKAEMGLYTFAIPESASAGNARIWLSPADNPEANGTVTGQIIIMPFYGVVSSDPLGIQFSQPKGWRLYKDPETITLANGPQEAAQPVEEIHIQSKASKWPDYSKVERTEQVTVAGLPAARTYLQRQTANATAGWLETHTVVRDVDIVLAYRAPLTEEMTTAYNYILDSLSFR